MILRGLTEYPWTAKLPDTMGVLKIICFFCLLLSSQQCAYSSLGPQSHAQSSLLGKLTRLLLFSDCLGAKSLNLVSQDLLSVHMGLSGKQILAVLSFWICQVHLNWEWILCLGPCSGELTTYHFSYLIALAWSWNETMFAKLSCTENPPAQSNCPDFHCVCDIWACIL